MLTTGVPYHIGKQSCWSFCAASEGIYYLIGINGSIVFFTSLGVVFLWFTLLKIFIFKSSKIIK
jgi:hypothetical protein